MKKHTFSIKENTRSQLEMMKKKAETSNDKPYYIYEMVKKLYGINDISGYEDYLVYLFDSGYVDVKHFSKQVLELSVPQFMKERKEVPAVLMALMRKTLIPIPFFEKTMVDIRKNLLVSIALDKPLDYTPEFISTLSQQCFLNEYVYYSSDDEELLLKKLVEEKLKLAMTINILDKKAKLVLMIFSCYYSLQELVKQYPKLHNLCKQNNFDKEIMKLQMDNYIEEHKIKNDIVTISSIDDDISQGVQQQYEENPYPRWNSVDAAFGHNSDLVNLNYNLGGKLDFDLKSPHKVLIAGCGTGKHALMKYNPKNKMTAIDLSKSSLAYAIRSAKDFGINDIKFLQADILNLDKLTEEFDVIESSGVLHHTRSIEESFESLYKKLKPKGMFNLGLYSTKAREALAHVRKKMQELLLSKDIKDIRYIRYSMLSDNNSEEFNKVSTFNDFYSTSMFIDLLLHHQEITVDIPFLKSLIEKFNMKFLGFSLQPTDPAIKNYKKMFPEDKYMLNLDNWDLFEKEYKDTFRGMYQFWMQKK